MKKIITALAFLIISNLAIAQEKEIKELIEKQRSDWNKGDITAYMQGYAKSDSLLFVSKSGPEYGWRTVLNNYQKFYPDKASMGYLTFGIKQIKMLDKKHALVLGSWHLKREKDEPQGYFTLLVEKFKDGWKVVVDHTS